MFEHKGFVDPAYALLLVDKLEQMLKYVGQPDQAAYALSEHIREITGARLVVLLPRDGQGEFTVYPESRRKIAESPEAGVLFKAAMQMNSIKLWDTRSEDPAAERLFSTWQLANCMSVPLCVSGERIGTLIIIDISLTGNIDSLIRTMDKMSGVLGLIMRNAGFHEEVGHLIDERTRELTKINDQLLKEISERKLAEKALRESEEKFRVLADTSAAVIYLYQGENLVYVNEAAQRITGYSKDELLMMKFWDIIHPDFKELFKERGLARQRGEQVPSPYEIKFITKSGGTRWAELTAGRIEYMSKPAGVATFFDITERKRTEEALRVSEANLARAQEIAHLGSWNWDIVNNIVCWSDELYLIFGVKQGEFEPSYDSYIKAAHPDDRELAHAVLQDTLKDFEPHSVEHRIVLPDDSIRWIIVDAKAFLDKRGKPTYLFGTAHDITERKLAEEALQDSRDQAELYVDLMSHDINNMNQIGMGYLEMAHQILESEGSLNRNNEHLIEKPLESLINSSKLIDNVRKLQKAKTRDLRLEHVDVCKILDSIIDRYSHAIGKDVTINYVPPTECMVEANELIYDVFVNLIENSIKHTHEDHPLVIDIIQSRACDDGIEYHMVAVEDNGPGIPDELKAKLFIRFQRGKTRARGKGLGLYLVKTLVKDYQGKVWVEDRVTGDHTKGSRFVVMLPAV